MRTIESTCDPAFDRAVRAVWRQPADGGADSLADNPQPGRRPHLALAVCGRIAPDRLAAVGELLFGALPLRVRPSGLLSFAARSRRRVPAWGVAPGPELVDPHREAWRLPADEPDPAPVYLPGRWMPDLGLTRRVEPDALAPAHRLLGRRPDLTGAFDAARSFDADSRSTVPLGA
ncbi:2'-5' RNA ligase family protein [Kitasatospora phosalacinea]|uniref:2'-5' RNA ligase family protein n=1 Tax=Kitasatospora phosalacinea TaxID=2065 RepID=A0ABW6GSW0_9ACTN